MSSPILRFRGTPCGYCAVPVVHPNQQCCLNCKNHPFDILEFEDEEPRPDSADATTPPSRAVSATGNPLAFEIRNIHDGTFVRISADDLKDEALQRHYDAGLVFEVERSQGDKMDIKDEPRANSIVANHAVGIKIDGNAFGKTCLFAGDRYILDRDDENMAGSVIIRHPSASGSGTEYSISKDSLDYTKVTIEADSKAWYDEDDGHPSAWLFHERILYNIEDEDWDEAESDFDFEDEKLHGVVFNLDIDGQYIGPDDLYGDRLLVECEGTRFSIKALNVVVEVELNENAYAQKLRENYGDQEQFWFQFGDKVWVISDDDFDARRVIVSYEDEYFSIAKEDLDI